MSLPVSSTDSVRKAQARAMSSVEARTYNQDAMDAFSRLAPPPSMEYPIAPDADAPNAPSA
ncbi:hypothetical protein E3P92_04157 [Wallemia ichthyophaga]|nr:hypothetical protein E3P91_04181 [Wallemia ichthyophaga]TIA77511.1 hypothetical protein E3P98_04142 [Wallemia ichthyophaga]TIA94634.1 hypothetical protein E3P95_04152 [Wallemia ichthyophaga]TIA95012.1 hypothetical protein E3P94_04153 [Wallemia ichthyophaga]TIB06921.1 hypothetical protein E3P93_04138 [Wallemia ichthyophaga]